jgi:hypothetical protein
MAVIVGMVDMTYLLELGMSVGRQRVVVCASPPGQIGFQRSAHRRGALVAYTGLEEVWAKSACEGYLGFSCSIAVRDVLGDEVPHVAVVEMPMTILLFSRGLQDVSLASCLV